MWENVNLKKKSVMHPPPKISVCGGEGGGMPPSSGIEHLQKRHKLVDILLNLIKQDKKRRQTFWIS